MRIRTQLILAFLVLSVVPLSGIVLYSYFSSQRTLRQAVEADATAMTHEMDVRMSAIRDDLGRGLERLGELPVDTLLDAAGGEAGRPAREHDLMASRVLDAMGNAAPLVESIAFTPALAPNVGVEVEPDRAAPAHPPSHVPMPPRAPKPPAAPAPRPLPSRPAPPPPAAEGAAAAAAGALPAVPAGRSAPTVIIPLRKILIDYRAAAAGDKVGDAMRQADIGRLVEQALSQAEMAHSAAARKQQEAIARWMEKRPWPFGAGRRKDGAGKGHGRQPAGPAAEDAPRHPGSSAAPGPSGAPGLPGSPGPENAGLSPQELQELEDLGASFDWMPKAPAPPAPPAPPGPAVPAPASPSAPGAPAAAASPPAAASPAVAAPSASAAAPPPASAFPTAVAQAARGEAAAARRLLAQQREQMMVLGDRLAAPVRQGDRVVGHVTAQISCPTVLRAVLARSRRDAGEIPFALNAQGQLYAINKADEDKLRRLPLASMVRAGTPHEAHRMSAAGDDWVVVTQREPASGLVLGIARPIGRSLRQVAETAGRNFGYGLSLIAIALIGILPLSRGMTRDLRVVTDGAQRIAQGDLATRVPVRSRSEFGQLATAFNRMAEDLTANQQQLIERELEQRLLRREYDRKTAELEEARRFQLALLPKTLPEHPDFAIAVSMRTATEVGGDYYDFHLDSGDAAAGILTVAIGDATGHGAKAGTMVTAIKGLLSADFAAEGLSSFLASAARAVRRMDLDRMAMALALARLSPGALTVSSAGMPPVLVYRRRTGEVEEISLPGMPLGGMPCDYQEHRLEVAEGDTVLLTTDGLPELADAAGDPLGYPRVRALLAACGGSAPEAIVAHLTAAADAWTAGQQPKDDMTLVVLQVRRAGASS